MERSLCEFPLKVHSQGSSSLGQYTTSASSGMSNNLTPKDLDFMNRQHSQKSIGGGQ